MSERETIRFVTAPDRERLAWLWNAVFIAGGALGGVAIALIIGLIGFR